MIREQNERTETYKMKYEIKIEQSLKFDLCTVRITQGTSLKSDVSGRLQTGVQNVTVTLSAFRTNHLKIQPVCLYVDWRA
jgi:hypothetical protein